MSRLRPDRIVRMAQQGYVPISDAALASGYNEVTLRRLAESGRIVCTLFGARRFLRWDSVLDYIGHEAVRLTNLPDTAPKVLRVAAETRAARATA